MSTYFNKLFHNSRLVVAAFVLTPIKTEVIPLRFFTTMVLIDWDLF